MTRIALLMILLLTGCHLAHAGSSPLVIGTISESPMQVTMNGVAVPAYTVNDTTCIFVGDLAACGFRVEKNAQQRVTLVPVFDTSTSTAPPTRSAKKVSGPVAFPTWRLFISNRQVPAFEYEGRLLMQVQDLSVFGTLTIDLPGKRISVTTETAWQDPYGFVLNFSEPTEDDLDIAPDAKQTVRWHYVYLKDLFGSQDLVISDRLLDDDVDGVHWLVGQILAAKFNGDTSPVYTWSENPLLADTRAYVESPRVAAYLRRVATARVSSFIAMMAQAAAEEKAARQEAFRKNGSRPLKITYYYVEDDEYGTPVAYTKVLNLSEKTVDAFDLDLYCYDTFGRPVKIGKAGNRQQTIYQDRIAPGYEVTIYIKLYARDLTTRVHPVLTRVHFTDGSVWSAKTSASRRKR